MLGYSGLRFLRFKPLSFEGLGLRGWGSGFRVQGLGYRVRNFVVMKMSLGLIICKEAVHLLIQLKLKEFSEFGIEDSVLGFVGVDPGFIPSFARNRRKEAFVAIFLPGSCGLKSKEACNGFAVWNACKKSCQFLSRPMLSALLSTRARILAGVGGCLPTQ